MVSLLGTTLVCSQKYWKYCISMTHYCTNIDQYADYICFISQFFTVEMLFPDDKNSYNNYSYMSGDANIDPLFTQDIKPLIKMETVSPPAAQYQPQQHWQAVGAVNNAGYVDQHTPPPQIIEGLDEYMPLSTGD